MISPDNFYQFIEGADAALPGLKHSVVVVDQDHLRSRIKEVKRDEHILAAVLPSHDRQGAMDSTRDFNTFLVFVLKKVDYSDRKFSLEREDYQQCFEIVQELLAYMEQLKSEGCNFLSWYDGNVSVDPEYNFQECDGYALSFVIRD